MENRTLTFRPTTLNDAHFLLAWRNNPDTRANSRNPEEVPWEHHLAWLTKFLNGGVPGRLLYIAEEDGMPVGTVRSDAAQNGSHELSWTVAPEARGRGVGRAMVVQFVREVLPSRRITAVIKEGNTASEKIAHALGLVKTHPERAGDTDPGHRFMVWQ